MGRCGAGEAVAAAEYFLVVAGADQAGSGCGPVPVRGGRRGCGCAGSGRGVGVVGYGWSRWTARPPISPTHRRTGRCSSGGPSNHSGTGLFRRCGGSLRPNPGPARLIEATFGPTPAANRRWPWTCWALHRRDVGDGRPELPVPHPGPRHTRHRRAHPVAGFGIVQAEPGQGPCRRHIPRRVEARPQGRRTPITVRVIEYTVHTTPTR